jgi:dTDP-4-amino-4,6-dideoxygalactose transaminase
LIKLMPEIDRPGSQAATHTHWVFPIRTPDPDALMRELWARGFDATRGASSLAVVEPPPGHPVLEPVEARTTMRQLLYLPVSPHMRQADLERLASVVKGAAASELIARLSRRSPAVAD